MILATLFRHYGFLAPKDFINYLAFQPVGFECTWWRWIQKCVVHTIFDKNRKRTIKSNPICKGQGCPLLSVSLYCHRHSTWDSCHFYCYAHSTWDCCHFYCYTHAVWCAVCIAIKMTAVWCAVCIAIKVTTVSCAVCIAIKVTTVSCAVPVTIKTHWK
jgi:hypothetical protein